jgi:hypothetical protein
MKTLTMADLSAAERDHIAIEIRKQATETIRRDARWMRGLNPTARAALWRVSAVESARAGIAAMDAPPDGQPLAAAMIATSELLAEQEAWARSALAMLEAFL